MKYNEKLIEFKFTGQKKIIRGLLISYSKNWTIIISNPVDYVCDGLLFLKNDKIKKYRILSDELIESKIIKMKSKKHIRQKLEFDDVVDILSFFNSKKSLFALTLVSGEFFVGRSSKIDISKKNFIFTIINSDGCLVENRKVPFQNIISFEYGSDYLIAIQDYMKKYNV